MRLAKAAGVDGFFVSVYSWVDPRAWTIFQTMLDIAAEEGFALGVEDWMPNPGETDAWKAEVLRQIDAFGGHPAFLRMNGLPAFWFNDFGPWTSGADLAQFLDSRRVHWILGGGFPPAQIAQLDQTLTQARVDQYISYDWPTTSGWAENADFVTGLRSMSALGLSAIGHGYPGYDERMLSHDPGRAPPRYAPREGGAAITRFLSAALEGGASHVIFESFNDWLEYTMFEPGIDLQSLRDVGQDVVFGGDPYAPLRLLASFKGVDLAPPLPPCRIVDPRIASAGVVACDSNVVVLPATLQARFGAVGTAFTITYHWSGGPTPTALTAFVHFVDAANTIVFGDDHVPPTPTNAWSSGPVDDTRTFIVPRSAHGAYSIMVGLYDPLTGTRYPLVAGPGVSQDDELRYRVGTFTAR
jgi:hypothetical protein